MRRQRCYARDVMPLLLMSGLLLLSGVARAHEGHSHGSPPKPKTPQERIAAVFFGDIPDPLPAATAIALQRAGRSASGATVDVQIVFTPEWILLGRGEPIRAIFGDPVSGQPFTGYAPKATVTFPSGAVSRGTMIEIAGHPGIYEYTPTFSEVGVARFEVSIGTGPKAPLTAFTEPIHVKSPAVPLASWIGSGILLALLLSAAIVSRVTGTARYIGIAVAFGAAVTVALMVRAPYAAAHQTIVEEEGRHLAAAEIQRDAPWPDPKSALELESLDRPAIVLPSREDRGGVALYGPASIRGTLSVPDDARAIISSPYVGIFTTAKILPRGTRVSKGQTLGTIRVNNEEVAPAAASAPGELATRRSELASAESVLAQAQADLERGRTLYAANVIPRRELEGYERAVEQAAAAVEAARGAVTAAETSGEALQRLGGSGAVRSHAVVAPLDGVVIEVGISPGEAVTEGQLLYSIVDPSRLWIEAALFEDQLRQLTPGAERSFVVGQDTTQRFTARLRTLGVMLDPESRTLPALFEVLPPFEGLFAGQVVTLLPPDEASR